MCTEARKASRLSPQLPPFGHRRKRPSSSTRVNESGANQAEFCNPKTRSSAWQWDKKGKEAGGNVGGVLRSLNE